MWAGGLTGDGVVPLQSLQHADDVEGEVPQLDLLVPVGGEHGLVQLEEGGGEGHPRQRGLRLAPDGQENVPVPIGVPRRQAVRLQELLHLLGHQQPLQRIRWLQSNGLSAIQSKGTREAECTLTAHELHARSRCADGTFSELMWEPSPSSVNCLQLAWGLAGFEDGAGRERGEGALFNVLFAVPFGSAYIVLLCHEPSKDGQTSLSK